MGLQTLYRPVGIEEYRLIAESGFRAFPPRLEWQPIFYPVLNLEYAEQIARDWNARGADAGIVSAFDLDAAYVEQFEVRQVGGRGHQELWVPAERLAEFNEQIQGPIRIVAAFYGDRYEGDRVEVAR